MSKSYCYWCMNELGDQTLMCCPHCGKSVSEETPAHHLPPGAVIGGEFLVGRALGEGGFGITYIGRDLTLDMPVAIKEFYPHGLSNRNNAVSMRVTITGKDKEAHYAHEKARCLQEARVLARFNKEPGIVSVRRFFEENNTAYIVMDFIDGITLKQYIEEKGVLTGDALTRMLSPVMLSLEKIHKQQVIHRDISPDNIMVTPDGSLILLDFGAAREIGGGKSLSVMLKPGFAPEEQYRSRGEQGPWTDVYALSATMYYCLTGERPEESIQRALNPEDELKRPTELGAQISPWQESVILRGMAIRGVDRYQSMRQLHEALTQEPKPSSYTVQIEPQESREDKESDAAPETNEDEPSEDARGRVTVLMAKPEVSSAELRQESASEAEQETEGIKTEDHEEEKMPEPEADALPQEAKEAAEMEEDEALPVSEEEADQLGQQSATAPEGETKPKKRSQGFGWVMAAWILAMVLSVVMVLGREEAETQGGRRPAAEASVSAFQPLSLPVMTSNATIAAGDDHIAAVKKDGTVMAAGATDYDQCKVENWYDIVSIAAGGEHTVGLKANGAVMATGDNRYGQCKVEYWADVVFVTAGRSHTVGLKADGTAIATGENDDDECEVENWTNLVSVAAGIKHTVGLKKDGTVVATGFNAYGQCDVENWTDVVCVAAGGMYTVGLKADGTVVATGDNEEGQCNVETWTDIVSVVAGVNHTVGLKADGTVLATGESGASECDVEDWTNIVSLSAGWGYTVGLRADGTVLATGSTQKRVSGWIDIRLPDESVIFDDGEVCAVMTANQLLVTMYGLDVQDTYVFDKSETEKDTVEYLWDVKFNDGQHSYMVGTMYISHEPGQNRKGSIDELQHLLWIETDDRHWDVMGEVGMFHDADSITWVIPVFQYASIDFATLQDVRDGASVLSGWESSA